MSITVADMNKQIEKIAELRVKEENASRVKKEIQDELALEEGRMLEMLSEAGLQNYRGPAGMAGISFRTSVKTPKSLEDKAAFFEFLKQRGLYDTMVSVNSQTLNSFYKSEMEAAKEAGKEDFEIPGIREVTINQILSFRK